MKILRPRLLLAIVSLAAPQFSQGQTPAPAAPAAALPTQGSQVWVWETMKFNPSGTGGRREVTNLPTATLRRFESHISTLNVGLNSHAPHKHGQEEFIILREGNLEIHINGGTQRVGPGSMFFFASNDSHNVTNVGDKPATYLVFNFQTALTAAVPVEGTAAATLAGKLPAGTLQSTVYDWEKLVAAKTEKGERRQLMNSLTATCANLEGHVTTLNPGEAPHAAHRHPDEELIVVKEGLMEVTIDGVTTRGGPGSIFFYASNALHGMKNVGTTTATYYVFRVITEATPKEPKPV